MSALEGSSVPPPGWNESQSVAAREPVSAAPFPKPIAAAVQPLVAGAQPAAEAAVRWRIRAATIDNLLVYAVYLLVCAVLHWRVTKLDHLLVLLGLGVVYHFALESRDGQTIGKRRYGIQVVSVNGERAGPKAIALRSVLRLIDSLPFWYLSGLISMVRTGPERRQRIGDVAAETKVIAIDGRSVRQGTPRWLLPTATLAALAVSSLSIYGIAEAGRQPLDGNQQAQFIAGCERTVGGVVDCQCFLNRLEADGYNSADSLNSLVQQANSERFFGQSGSARRELAADALACRE
jgi:uncharacterized RDD family membrane protein YckC